MERIRTSLRGREAIARRAAELNDSNENAIFEHTDKLFARLLASQWVVGVLLALLVAPRAWAGRGGSTLAHIFAAVVVGAAFTLYPALIAYKRPGKTNTRYVVAAGQMLTSALLIHLTGGRIEAHFHVFGSLAVLSFYRDWRIFIPAGLVFVLDHFFRGAFWPDSIYGTSNASQWRWLEHAFWVSFQAAFLVAACIRSRQEMSVAAEQRAQLEYSGQRYRSVIEQTAEGIFLADGYEKRMVECNAAFREMMGYSFEEAIDVKVFEIASNPEAVFQGIESTLTQKKPFTTEERFHRRDGSTVDVEMSMNVISYNGEQALCTVVRDITERKRMEEAIAREQEGIARERDLLNTLINRIPDTIYFKDAEGLFTRINKAEARLLGITDPELAAGKMETDFIPGEGTRVLGDLDLEVLASGRPLIDKTQRISLGDGSRRWILATRVPIKDKEGAVVGLVGISKDITERKLNEEALEHALADFLEVVSAASEGDLTARGLEGDETLGRIAAAVNRMLDNFGRMLAQVKHIALSVSSSATQILATSEQITVGAQKQASEITNMSSSVDEMAASMVQVTRNAESSVTAGRHAIEIARFGDESVGNTSEGMSRIDEAVQRTADKMRLLARRGSEISEIISLITEIASQTNLLSLNAAIQAAHAGDAGLGFSVVAEEIRKLAERSAEATKRVSDLVKGVQTETAEALLAMENGMKEVGEGKRLAREARQALQDISGVVKQSSLMIEEISSASEEQARVTRGVAEAMQVISSIAIETSAGTRQSTQSVYRMVSLSESLNEAISQFKFMDELRQTPADIGGHPAFIPGNGSAARGPLGH